MPTRLKLSRIERKPKKVFDSPNFQITADFRGRPELAVAMADIREAIKLGHALPSWAYRKYIDETEDGMLNLYGFMHLHLGKQDSKELLFLVQYPERVFFLEVNSHAHFATSPPGTLLRKLHDEKMRALNEQLTIAERDAKRAAIASSLQSRNR